MLALALLVTLHPPDWPEWIVVVLLIFAGIEATTRGRLTNFLLPVTLVLAVITGAILVVEFWQVILVLIAVGVVLLVMVGNLRELRNG